MTERTLFPDDDPGKLPDKPLPHSGSTTSKAAAESMKPHAGQQREQVRRFFTDCGELGATQQEVELALGISGNSVRPRCKELEQSGEIKNSGSTRPTLAKRNAAVWVIVSPDVQPAATSASDWPLDNPDKAGG